MAQVRCDAPCPTFSTHNAYARRFVSKLAAHASGKNVDHLSRPPSLSCTSMEPDVCPPCWQWALCTLTRVYEFFSPYLFHHSFVDVTVWRILCYSFVVATVVECIHIRHEKEMSKTGESECSGFLFPRPSSHTNNIDYIRVPDSTNQVPCIMRLCKPSPV